MKDRTRERGRAALRKMGSARARVTGAGLDLSREIDQLTKRVGVLEREMQETRRLNRRLAELTDVVQELLIPLAQQDPERVNELLDRYSARL